MIKLKRWWYIWNPLYLFVQYFDEETNDWALSRLSLLKVCGLPFCEDYHEAMPKIVSKFNIKIVE